MTVISGNRLAQLMEIVLGKQADADSRKDKELRDAYADIFSVLSNAKSSPTNHTYISKISAYLTRVENKERPKLKEEYHKEFDTALELLVSIRKDMGAAVYEDPELTMHKVVNKFSTHDAPVYEDEAYDPKH